VTGPCGCLVLLQAESRWKSKGVVMKVPGSSYTMDLHIIPTRENLGHSQRMGTDVLSQEKREASNIASGDGIPIAQKNQIRSCVNVKYSHSDTPSQNTACLSHQEPQHLKVSRQNISPTSMYVPPATDRQVQPSRAAVPRTW
jgi:hypothetical protein